MFQEKNGTDAKNERSEVWLQFQIKHILKNLVDELVKCNIITFLSSAKRQTHWCPGSGG